jgi:hypothetical protein
MRWVTGVLATLALLLGVSAPAGAVSGTTAYASHPSILAKPSSAWAIHDLAVDGGRLFMGYGDWNGNTGPVDLAYVNLSDGTTGVAGVAPSEAINTWRVVNGQLAAPWIDPTGWGGAVPPNGGFSTTTGNVHAFPASHVFDVEYTAGSWFLAGASAYEVDGAVIYRSTDGATWHRSKVEAAAGGVTGWERFYWVRAMGGKVYAQAAHNGSLFPMVAWDGTRWANARKGASPGLVTQASDIEAFAGRLWTTSGRVTDGKRARSSGAPFGFVDLYRTTDRLYGIASDGRVAYTTGGAWVTLPGVAVPAGVHAQSLAVHGGNVYVGSSGRVYRSAL